MGGAQIAAMLAGVFCCFFFDWPQLFGLLFVVTDGNRGRSEEGLP